MSYLSQVLLVILLSTVNYKAEAQQFTKWVQVDYLGISATQFQANRDPMTPDIGQDEYQARAALEMDLSVAKYLFWENRIHTESVASTVKTVGWHWIAGIRFLPWLDVIHEHHSRHVMDQPQERYNPETGKREKYPVEDSYGIRIHIIMKPKQSKSLY
jgi:hypothetical protein